MRKIIKHLRGTASDWSAKDIIVPDGELAFSVAGDNVLTAKLGNGSSKFSELRALNMECKNLSNLKKVYEFTAENHLFYQIGSVKSMKINLPYLSNKDYHCMIGFDTKNCEADFVMDKVYFTGDDTVDGEFIPIMNRCYTLVIWYSSSRFNGVVRGIPYV